MITRSESNPRKLFGVHQNYGPIRDAVKEGYYQMNLKARLEGGDIICWERDIDIGDRYLCVMGDGSVDYVSLADWKKALGKP